MQRSDFHSIPVILRRGRGRVPARLVVGEHARAVSRCRLWPLGL
jgi:hypothetical protein